MEKVQYWWLCCVTFIFVVLLLPNLSNGKEYGALDEQMMQYADFTLDDLLERYKEGDQYNFWYPNTFKTGVQSREVVRISSVTKKSIPGVYKQWKSAQIGTRTIISGLTSHGIHFYDEKLKLLGVINTNKTLVALTTFGLWNDELSSPELIFVVATDQATLESYSFTGSSLSQLGTWPLQNRVKSLEICVVELSTKIVVVAENSQAPVDIYNFEARQNSSQFWFFQRLNIGRHTCVAVHDVDSSTCSISIASDKEIGLFSFEPKIGRFVEHNNLGNVSVACHQLIPLRLSYSDYLAYVPVPESHRPVELFSESGIDYLNQNLSPIHATELISLPIGNIRHEDILLLRTPYNSTKILSYDGLKRMFKETFECTPELCPEISHLSNGVGTLINGTTVFFVPTQEGQNFSTVLIIASQIDEYTSPLYERARQLYAEFRSLSEVYVRFQNIVKSVKVALLDSLSQSEPNVITGNWSVHELSSFNTEIFDLTPTGRGLAVGQNFETIEFINSPLQTEDFLIDDSKVEARLKIFQSFIVTAEQRTAKTVPLDSDQVFHVTALQKINAHIETPLLTSDRIRVGGVNDIVTNLDDFFSGFVLLEDSNVRINGRVEFGGVLTMNNLEASQINGISTKYFALLSSKNIFNTSIIFQSHFTVLGNILTTDRIAGLNFPSDLVLASNVTGVTLKNNLIALEKAELVDRVGSVLIDFDEFEKNILLNDATQQNITSHITFNAIVLRGNGTVVNLNGNNFARAVKSIVVKSQNGTIRGDKNFQYPNVSAEFLAIIKTLNSVPFPSGYISVKEQHIIFHGCNNYSYISANLVDIDGTINHVNTKDVVRRKYSVESEVNHSKWTLKGPVTFADDLHVRETVAGVNVSDFHSHDTFDVAKTKYFPNHNIRFEAPVVLDSLHVFHTINEKSFDESFGNTLLCPENGQDITVHGPTTFQNNGQFDHLIVKSNKVNGIDLDNFFLRNKEQNITKNFVFTRPVRFSKIFALSKVDGILLQDVLKDAIFLNGDQSLSSALTFESIISSAPVTINGPINNFTNFREDVALKTGRQEQTFQSHIVFTDVEAKNLNVTENFVTLSYLDGLNITRWNEERVSLSRGAVLHHPIEIFGDVIVHKNIVTNSINNVSLNYLSQGVLRTDRTHQEFFNAIQNTGSLLVTGDAQFHQSLNGYSLANIIRDSVPLHGHVAEDITGHWRLESAVFHKLLINGTTCGVDVIGLSRDSVRVNSTNVTFTGTTTFQQSLLAEDEIQTGSIDAVDFFNHVFTLATPQIVTSSIVWKKDVNVQNLFQLDGRINGVSLKHLNSIYSFQHGTHTLHSDVNFDSSFTVKNLVVDGLIQNKNLSEFLSLVVPKSSNHHKNTSSVVPVIRGNVIFTQPIISEGNILSETINNIHVSALAHDLIKKNSVFNFTSPVCFSNSVGAQSLVLTNGSVVTVNNLVGQIDIRELQVDSIPLNSDTPIFSETLVFEDVVIDGDVEGVRVVNGIPISDFITLDSEQAVGSLKVSKLILNQHNITTKGHFGGINVGAAARDTILIYNQSESTITGPKNFTGRVLIDGGFHCLGVENVDQFVYLKEGQQRIRSPVVFVDDLNVDGDVDWTGRWNGVSMKELEEYGVSSYGDDVISADWNYPGGIVFNNYTVSHGLIDGVNMTKLERESRQKVAKAEDIIENEQTVFSQTCQMYQKLYNHSLLSPIKLQSFDEQQLIVSDKHVGKMLTVRAGHSLFLLTSSSDVCGILVYRWSTAFEEFHELGLAHHNDIAIDNWAQAPHLDHGIIIFSSLSTPQCHQSDGEQVVGLHFVLINEVGALSAKVLIQNGTVKSFKLVSDESKTVTLLFVVYQERPQHITIYSWLGTNQTTFVREVSFDMASQVKILDVNQPRNGNVLLLLQSATTVSINVYSLKDKRLTQLSHAEFYGSSITTSMRMFEVDDSLYALVLMKNSERSSIKPDCSLQLFKSNKEELEFVQKLKIYDMVSVEILRIGHQVFVVVLTKPVGLYVYKFMGLSGLQTINHYPLKFHGGENLSAFHVTPWRYNTSLPFVLVSSRNVIKLYHSNILGNTVTDYDLQSDRNYLCNFQ